MRRNISHWQIGGFVFVSVFGSFLHFLFDLTNGSFASALISPVNESIWEHLKLLYFPMVFFALWEYFVWGRGEQAFWQIKLAGISAGLFAIPVLYYTYTGISGVNADWLNITIFFVIAAAVYYLETKFFLRPAKKILPVPLSVFLLIVWGIALFLLTFFPPRIPFFQDPVTGTYGFSGSV